MGSVPIILMTVFLYMCSFFLVAVIRKDNSLADIAWGGGFVLIAFITFSLSPGYAEARQVLATGLVTLWGVRLAIYIYFRNLGRGEDYRYAKWREEWGKYFLLRSFLQVFMLQGALMILISYSVIFINLHPVRGLTWLDGLGLLVWITGFFFESLGDFQLYQFKKDPSNRGKVMKYGLWRYTRHPNYFGEATMWWGIFLMALSLDGGFTALISPAAITFLLLKVSGIPMLEKKLIKSQPGYRRYMESTSPFIPWFPRGS
ncbi:MAG TPA: DUF1295 domain-containing protein [Synergistales bacterium]|nr:DUF1295 domain-containing protein [Synergistales bacterium]